MNIKRVELDKEGNVTAVEFWSEIGAMDAAHVILTMQKIFAKHWPQRQTDEAPAGESDNQEAERQG